MPAAGEIVSQDALLATIQLQVALAVSGTTPVPPAAATVCTDEPIEAGHTPVPVPVPAWVTLSTLPPMTMAPARADAVVLAATAKLIVFDPVPETGAATVSQFELLTADQVHVDLMVIAIEPLPADAVKLCAGAARVAVQVDDPVPAACDTVALTPPTTTEPLRAVVVVFGSTE